MMALGEFAFDDRLCPESLCATALEVAPTNPDDADALISAAFLLRYLRALPEVRR